MSFKKLAQNSKLVLASLRFFGFFFLVFGLKVATFGLQLRFLNEIDGKLEFRVTCK